MATSIVLVITYHYGHDLRLITITNAMRTSHYLLGNNQEVQWVP